VECILTQISLKGTEVLQQNIPRLLNAAHLVGTFSLSIHFTHLRIVLRGRSEKREVKGEK
jgi:hypothetical protein